MENISELIQKIDSYEHRDTGMVTMFYLHQSLKDLIDAVIEDEENEIQPFKVSENTDSIVAWNNAKNDTISKLKAIKEML